MFFFLQIFKINVRDHFHATIRDIISRRRRIIYSSPTQTGAGRSFSRPCSYLIIGTQTTIRRARKKEK